ncbi:MAG: queuosine precursor transporter [Lentimicrobiaceae bacterium]|nr:queuosine precursor transporter [Lentimicrobiaceae bacterium]MCB9022990.1 queuosine precursor transporter [Lentimicrobiaceae bacterium]HPG33684.1 queuosine precursor transporter [Lentimicrobium sp.]
MNTNQSSAKKQQLYLILSAIFLTNAMVAEFAGVKIFSFEKLLGFMPAQIPFWGGQKLDFNLSVGVVIWPFVFLISDLINEYFGREGVRKISFITAGMIAWSFLVILAGTELPPAQFWLDLNNTDPAGNAFDINFAYSSIFRAGMGIIAGSLTAFLVSQLIDAYTFHYLKRLTGHKRLWLRATGSTIVSQLIDSFVILFIAFFMLGNWSLQQVFQVGLVQYTYKVALAILLTPLIYIAHWIIDRYLGKSA